MFAEEVEKSSEKFDIYSIDIAPANEKVFYSDFSYTGLFERKSEEKSDEKNDNNKIEFIEKSFDQVSFLYLLSYMPDPILRFQEYFSQFVHIRGFLATEHRLCSVWRQTIVI